MGRWSIPSAFDTSQLFEVNKGQERSSRLPHVHGWTLYLLVCGLYIFLTWIEVIDIGNPRQMQGAWRERFMMHPHPTIRPHDQREQAE